MATLRNIQIHRTDVAGRAPTAGSQEVGVLWVNMADGVLGYFDASKQATKLTSIPNFSARSAYAKNDLVLANQRICRALTAVAAGPFDSADWVYVDGAEISIGKTAPTKTYDGLIWIDTSLLNNPVLKLWDTVNSDWDVVAISQKDLAEGLLMGSTVGWDLVVAGADLDYPDTLTWTKAGETIRATVNWDSDKYVAQIVWESSTALGTMATLGTYDIRYNTNKQIVGGVWS